MGAVIRSYNILYSVFRLPNTILYFSSLISAKNLLKHYDHCVVIDWRFDLADPALGERRYCEGHLPQAQYAHLDKQLSGTIMPDTGRHPLPDFKAFHAQIERWGITNQTQIVAYDDTSGFFAARLWWLLRALGHQRVAVLDGGMQAWAELNGPLEHSTARTSCQTYTPRLNKDNYYDVDELQQAMETDRCVLIDARTKIRYDGIEEPIDPIAGHIPGALNLPSADNLDENGYFLAASTIRSTYQRLIEPFKPDQAVHYCGSGVFACFGVLAMEVAGLEGSKIYPGSWSEWIRDSARGIATR